VIVGRYFEGDDKKVAWKQHDVYYEALGIIISTCNKHVNTARAILQTSVRPGWGSVETCDHRTLQDAHDRLAAVWRSQNDFRQSSLISDDNRSLDDVKNLWLGWLRKEMEDWCNFPHLINSVQVILTNQNNRPGRLAEIELSIAIMDRFPQVPWNREDYDSFKQYLENFEE